MVYKRKSVSKMAAAAAASAAEASAWKYLDESSEEAVSSDIVEAVVVAVHEVIPDKAPAYAAEVARGAGAADAICIAIAAGVAAAADGLEIETVRKVCQTALTTFQLCDGLDPATIAQRVADAVHKCSSRYPAVEAAAAAACATYLRWYGADPSSEALPAQGTTGCGNVGVAKTHEFDSVEDWAAFAAADAAAKAVIGIGGHDSYSYAATAAARAATFRGACRRSVLAAAVRAATPTHSIAVTDLHDLTEQVAIAIAATSYEDSTVSPSLGARGMELLEAMPNSHDVINYKLQTIVGIDTFLVAFLLYSLRGEKEEGVADSEEVVQTVLQVYSFTVFLAAIITSGMFMVVTGGSYALTRNDVIIPTVLSTFGVGLLLVTVDHALFLEIGQGGDDHVALFWTTVVCCFLIQVMSIAVGLFFALPGSKYSRRIRVITTSSHSKPKQDELGPLRC